jgi:predicted nucleotidyltransferase
MMPYRKIQISHAIESVAKALNNFFTNRKEVVLAYLFGSIMEKRSRPIHDIDIAVLVAPDQLYSLNQDAPYGYSAEMNAKLAHLLQCEKIDLVILNEASPLLLRKVIGKGMIIYCAAEVERIKFEVAALKKHADTANLREIKRLYMRKRIEKGLAAYA